MGLMPSKMTPKQWGMAGVAAVVLIVGGYLIYDNLRPQGQAVSGSGSAGFSATSNSTGPAAAPGAAPTAPKPANPSTSGSQRRAPGSR
jgi:hypothetical protein